MSKSQSKVQRRVGKKSQAVHFDKYDLYKKAVQSPESDVDFYERVYKELKKKKPRILREDFCGTFALAAEWVKRNKSYQAYGLDIDPEPMEYGRGVIEKKFTADQKRRLKILEHNVLEPSLPVVDIAVAVNFSYFVFKTREQLRKYFANNLKGLKKDGLFIVDIFGGSQCMDACEDIHKKRKFTYYWDQAGFDPVTNEAQFYIHFRVKGKKIEKVFRYDWRMWSIPEVRELMLEAGFHKTHVYWEGTTRKGEGDGKFRRTEQGEACLSWIAYVVGEK